MNQIEQNDYRMKAMKQSHGDEYFRCLGEFVLKGYPLQNAIDACWELFKPENENL